MLLRKDGITIEVIHKADVENYLRAGYVKVEEKPAKGGRKAPEKEPEKEVKNDS